MLDNQADLMEKRATSSSPMQKFTPTVAGTHLVDITPGRTVYLSTSGTIAATVKYATAPGVFVPFATPITLSGQQAVVNYGAHSQLQIDVTSVTAGAIVIANPQTLQERGR
jgi:hypothetical protein